MGLSRLRDRRGHPRASRDKEAAIERLALRLQNQPTAEAVFVRSPFLVIGQSRGNSTFALGDLGGFQSAIVAV
jgi:hypothetical protein